MRDLTTGRHSGGGGDGGQECVEVAQFPSSIGVRDSKDPDGPRLVLDSAGWRALTRRIKASEHDLT
ncbi:DUF397 domain-containing protein [Actinomadura fulvescens]|uniref:DUF397 domain-containing protein n=1 Tax=Actinomadura fulvescens TaxID=46160 RepID=A0ABP6C2Z6_9ACTN